MNFVIQRVRGSNLTGYLELPEMGQSSESSDQAYTLGNRGPGKDKKPLSFSNSPEHGIHQPSHLVGTEDPFLGEYSGRGVKSTIHLHVVPKLRTNEATPPLPHTPPWCAEGHYLYMEKRTAKGKLLLTLTTSRWWHFFHIR
jgi:hypothetical protein